MKVLITADIHVDDYSDFNISFRSRLGQFDLLANRLIEIAKEYNCEEEWILGDIINRPNALSYIIHKGRDLIKVQCAYFKNVRYILGQHDLISKSSELKVEDSLVNLYDYPNFIYMDRKLLTVDNHVYGFMNWRENQDLDWTGDTHLDVLFGHYTKSSLFGQDIDESKFDLMIHGDIHNDQEIGKFISVGNPIQKDMSSIENGCVLIFDTETNKYERVRVDEDHTRFLRIRYTDDRALEGFHGSLLYNIYRPDITSSVGELARKTVTWDDIESLITNTCNELDLKQIHEECKTKCIAFNEIDFNFYINSVIIHGFRSIVDMELKMNKGDQIALLGENGSGKSSVIKAIRSVFYKNPDVKCHQSDFTDDCWVTLNLTYQNKVYSITKGTTWGMTIDGNELSYNNVTSFYEDVRAKLPFMDFVDLFFIDPEVSDLSRQFTSQRRIELISKFYRFDRIDAYYSTAMDVISKLNDDYYSLKDAYNVKLGVIEHVESRLKELEEYKDINLQDLEDAQNKYLDIQDQHRKHELWMKDYDNILTSIRESESKISKLSSITTFDVEVAKKDLEDQKKLITSLSQKYEELYKESVTFETNLKKILSLESEGPKLNEKLSTLKNGRCPECGSPLSSGQSSKLISELNTKLQEFRSEWSELDEIINQAPRKRDSKAYYVKALLDIKSKHKEVNDGIELLDNKIKNHLPKVTELKVESDRLEELKNKLKDVEARKVEDIKFPLDFNEKMAKLSSDIAKVQEYQYQLTELQKLKDDASATKVTLDEIDIQLTNWNRYSEVMCRTGVVYEQLLRQLAEKFTTTEVAYEVDAGVYRGSRYIEFESHYIMPSGRRRAYGGCSSGQKILCDLDFLSKLFSVQVGLLVMDEYLKHLDEKRFPKACEILHNMNVNTMILSTHDGNLTSYNRKLNLRLDENDHTVIINE